MVAVIAHSWLGWTECRTERTGGFPGCNRPVQTVLFPFAANNFLGVVCIDCKVVLLGVDISMQRLNGGQLVAANFPG
ncbi:hypothetical protein D3C79_1007180 [compost metagenome]